MLSGYERENYPVELGQLNNLQALKIINNDSLQQAPTFIPMLPQLRYLHIASCDKMTSFGPDYSKMNKLEEVDLPFNALIWEVPENLSHIEEKVRIKHANQRKKR